MAERQGVVLVGMRGFGDDAVSEERVGCRACCATAKGLEMPQPTPHTGGAPIPVTLPSQVNIDHFTKAMTMKNLVEPSPSSFDMAQKRIFALMEKDSLPRFVRSEFYQELIK